MMCGLFTTPMTEKGRDTKAWCIFGACVIVVVVGMAFGISGHRQAMGANHARALLTTEVEIDLVDSGIYVYKEYKYIYDRANRFEGPTGYLFVNEEPVLSMVRNKKVDTPWGVMYWHGVHDHRALPEGWMPYPNYRVPLK